MFDQVASLPLRVEEVRTSQQSSETSAGFARVTTTVTLDGDGFSGRGEDITYETVDQDRCADLVPNLQLAGEYTLESFTDRLGELDLFPTPPERDGTRHYRLWALESAALDLALRQAGASLGSVLDRRYDPVRFVVSPTLTETETGEPTLAPIERLRDRHSDLGVKVDATERWDEDFLAGLAATGGVEVVDFKGHYDVDELTTPADPALYERVCSQFPDAILEDPNHAPAIEPVLAAEQARLSWDAPITDVASVEALPFTPQWLNCKPSRFGTIRALFDFLAYCEVESIRLYGGGQFELDVGRRQIQSIAALWYPDGPNDVAPPVYNESSLPDRPPGSPLPPPSSSGAPGFGAEAADGEGDSEGSASSAR